MKTNKAYLAVIYVVLILFLAIVLLPLGNMLMISLKSNDEFILSPVSWPATLCFQNYIDAWKEGNFLRYGLNSIIVTGGTILLTVPVAAMAGYSLAKHHFKGKNSINNYFMLGLIVPVQILVIPLFKVVKTLHLFNNLLGLIVLFTTFSLPLGILVYRGFFITVPNELEQAARIDGCGPLGCFWKIVFPLALTTTSVVVIMVGMNPWKDFFIPMIFTSNPDLRTLPVGLLYFRDFRNSEWPKMFAAMIIQSMPMVILYLCMQKNFVKGVTTGAVKG